MCLQTRPQRDERLGWTGDAQAFCATASFHMETPAFYRKYLYDMKEDQKIYREGVPHVVPDVLGQVQRIKNQSEDPVTKEGGMDHLRFLCLGRCGLYHSLDPV